MLWMSRLRFVSFLFFQAEDGIRDLVRSRGLGDVYKRQELDGAIVALAELDKRSTLHETGVVRLVVLRIFFPVSYTHLTLPTSDLV